MKKIYQRRFNELEVWLKHAYRKPWHQKSKLVREYILLGDILKLFNRERG